LREKREEREKKINCDKRGKEKRERILAQNERTHKTRHKT